ncbi:hypothetical protein MNBD_PLANCTO03-1901 [hydrothermal vent metagenome]|uniref:Uncharacterized protein n=1 Tax=hydrothermal vent metagenome TaxID=652676 RepID=A0A3B1D799_9ZZZZ
MTVRQLVELTTRHLEHHNEFLQKKLDTMLGVREEAKAGGCGAGCCCVKSSEETDEAAGANG